MTKQQFIDLIAHMQADREHTLEAKLHIETPHLPVIEEPSFEEVYFDELRFGSDPWKLTKLQLIGCEEASANAQV